MPTDCPEVPVDADRHPDAPPGPAGAAGRLRHEPAPAPVALAPAPAPAAAPVEPRPSEAVARVEVRKWQVGMIGKASWGSGTLIHRGRRIPFRIGGAGLGGVGMARIRATGEVFNMTDVSQFPGTFGQFRAGVVAPGAEFSGPIWLQNTSGVVLRLTSNRTGLALNIGVDGILVEMR
ncbi:hypothetical protein ACFQS7_05065 [Dankookia sp. GCM10030260]|uniref:hypothetical protein n=1 Tax=Dankookia sp. GCM10030260 TaxID=3273390 RepID=UPI00361A0FD6